MPSRAEATYEKTKKKSRPGSGKRFGALARALSSKGADNPRALAAYIGRKKYGKKKMAKFSGEGC
jgi:hypothetical protein